MTRKTKFLAGGLVILAALGYLVYAGVSQSVVYFVTPSELSAAPVTRRQPGRLQGADPDAARERIAMKGFHPRPG